MTAYHAFTFNDFKDVVKPELLRQLVWMAKSGLILHDFELTTTCDGPHDTVADRTSCSVGPSAILSVTILTIRGYRMSS